MGIEIIVQKFTIYKKNACAAGFIGKLREESEQIEKYHLTLAFVQATVQRSRVKVPFLSAGDSRIIAGEEYLMAKTV